MEKILLGLLMLRKLTAYELHIMIKNHYQGICSHSLGNIQKALKKLAEQNLATCELQSNKKIYIITAKGRAAFLEWLKEPMDISKANNMELGKLLLLGFLPPQQQLEHIESAIVKLESDAAYFQNIEKTLQNSNEKVMVYTAYITQNKEFVAAMLASLHESDAEKLLTRLDTFGAFTLQFGIDSTKFYLDWFKNLKTKLEGQETP